MKVDMNKMTGGWQHEGIEKPPPIRICYKCQGIHRGDPMKDSDNNNWCEDCKEGKPPPGHSPVVANSKGDVNTT